MDVSATKNQRTLLVGFLQSESALGGWSQEPHPLGSGFFGDSSSLVAVPPLGVFMSLFGATAHDCGHPGKQEAGREQALYSRFQRMTVEIGLSAQSDGGEQGSSPQGRETENGQVQGSQQVGSFLEQDEEHVDDHTPAENHQD